MGRSWRGEEAIQRRPHRKVRGDREASRCAATGRILRPAACQRRRRPRDAETLRANARWATEQATLEQALHNRIVSFIWGIADEVLRDLFQRGKYPDVTISARTNTPDHKWGADSGDRVTRIASRHQPGRNDGSPLVTQLPRFHNMPKLSLVVRVLHFVAGRPSMDSQPLELLALELAGRGQAPRGGAQRE